MTAARAALAVAGAWELAQAAVRFAARRALYAAAQARAAALRRPLVVVGDPRAGAVTRLLPAYGCGDVCVDLAGCPACPDARAADLTAGPVAGLPADSAVVFAACVLEYTADAHTAYAELLRIAGAPENVFVVPVQAWTLTRFLYPGARWVVQAAPPAAPALAVEPVTDGQRLAVGAGLAALVIAAW